MNAPSTTATLPKPTELDRLLEAFCESRLTAEEARNLEALLMADPNARQRYLDYVQLHATLHWDAGMSAGVIEAEHSEDLIAAIDDYLSDPEPEVVRSADSSRSSRRFGRRVLSAAALVLMVGLSFWAYRPGSSPAPLLVDDASPGEPLIPDSPAADSTLTPPVIGHTQPIQIAGTPGSRRIVPNKTSEQHSAPSVADAIPVPTDVVAFIDQELESSWNEQHVTPSPLASDDEWLRRIFLDLTGTAPTSEQIAKFTQDRSPGKREALVDQLLEGDAFANHLAGVWADVLLEDSERPDAHRETLRQYLGQRLAKDASWRAITRDLITATGSTNDNPASAFLMAHWKTDGVVATSATARSLLGTRLSCVQCHDHPQNDWKQDRFWQLNGFFQQTELARTEPGTTPKLTSRAKAEPVFFETPSGLVKAAYPEYEDNLVFGPEAAVTPEAVNLRNRLAELLFAGETPLVAQAMVNRTWSHLFGHGFTEPVDDLGPHNPPTHPKLMRGLSRAFVASDYDVKQLVRWVCLSDAYRRTTQFGTGNAIDDPDRGTAPLFTRVYLKPLPEGLDELPPGVTGTARTTKRDRNTGPVCPVLEKKKAR